MPAGIPVVCMDSDKSLTLSWLNYSRKCGSSVIYLFIYLSLNNFEEE